MQESQSEKAERIGGLVSSGIMTIEEARAELGLCTKMRRILKDGKDGCCGRGCCGEVGVVVWVVAAPWPPGALTLALSRRAGKGTVVVWVAR